MAKVEKPHPMLHGQHNGKMPKEGKGEKKEGRGHKRGSDNHDKIFHHIGELHKLATMAGLGSLGALDYVVPAAKHISGIVKGLKSPKKKEDKEEKKSSKKPARVHEEKSPKKEIKPSQSIGKESLGRLEKIKKEQK
jgi:hypothetical protein